MELKKNKIYEGTFSCVNKSFGFVHILDENIDNKVYVDIDDAKFSLDEDIVEVKITKEKKGEKSAEGIITKILKRKNEDIVGIFTKNKNCGFVSPVNKKIGFDIHIDKKYMRNTPNNTYVIATLLPIKNKGRNPEGIIKSAIGNKNDPNAEILAIVESFKAPYRFDEKVIEEADRISKENISKNLKDRVDLRNLTTITIDGEDSKDLDDAISLEKLKDGNMKLYVSIADVSHYVKEDSYLDKEAKKRGNSIYLVDRVIPMLPYSLCNGICSLNEKEDRLTLTCEILYDKNANVLDSKVYESVINSNKRMTYTATHCLLNDLEYKGLEDFSKYLPYKELLKDMYELSLKIRKKREKLGSISFDLKETKIIVDDDCMPIDIKEYPRYETNKLIEDFMVSANEQVAKIFNEKDLPFVYRIHEKPSIEKLENLSNFLSNFGFFLSQNEEEIKPKQIQEILSKAKTSEFKEVIESVTLRSMMQAKYSPNEMGHFALALKYYSHFTSPIRRYSDLQIHRIIKESLHKELDEKRKKHYKKILPQICENISFDERRAVDIERDVDELKKCQYMKKFLNEEFEGKISNITSFGIYVALDNTIEGLIPLRDLNDDYYIFNENKYELVGQSSKKIFRIGMKLKIKVLRVEEEERNIDFSLVDIL